MANRTLFTTRSQPELTRNEAGGTAFALEPRAALAQYACTGTLGGTYYVNAETELETLLDLCSKVGDPEYVARTAVYAHESGFMKDAPAVLLCALVSPQAVAWESQRAANEAFARAFPRVVSNGRMLRNVVQILRSGRLGRRSLGSLPRRLIASWIEQAGEYRLLLASVGSNPSLRDVLRMVRPRPANERRAALYHYLAGSRREQPERDALLAPEIVAYRRLLAGDRADGELLPAVPFELLIGLPNLSAADWRYIALRATWQQTRANLNTFARHGVFEDEAVVAAIARKLADPRAVAAARVLPYQLLAAQVMAGRAPTPIPEALALAVAHATRNVPAFGGRVVVCPDLSGSMHSPVTGQRGSATTAVQCIDAAALVCYAVLRRNPEALVVPFTDHVHEEVAVHADMSLPDLATAFHTVSGGTAISAPLAWLNQHAERADVVIIVSDNQSWIDRRLPESGRDLLGPPYNLSSHTETLRQWEILRRRNPEAKLVCIDLQPNASTQAYERQEVLNVGGFSDSVFEIVRRFAAGEAATRWVELIEAVTL